MSDEVIMHSNVANCACAACAGGASDSVALDASVDGMTGTAANGKAYWSPEQIAAYLNRSGTGWNNLPGQATQSDTNLTEIQFGFHTSQATLSANGYTFVFGGTRYGVDEYFNFAPFSAAQKAAAYEAMQSWDDVIAVSLREATNINLADISLSNLASAPNTQAYAFLPSATINYYNNATVNAQLKDLAGDVWVSLNQPSNLQLDEGRYGLQTLTHEIGHALGISHPGGYNAAPGVTITYPVNAEYYQDTRAYTIMSYFEANVISGARHFDFHLSTTAYSGVPLVHDILAAQRIYGADMTTRTGDTVYGFNSNAGRDTFDFVKTPAPIGAIWDAGGIDTIDTSGFATTQLIDLRAGSLSSIGGVTYDTAPSFEQVNANRAANGFAPVARSTYDANMAGLLANPTVGRLMDNFAIAYGVTIENAIGGSGADTIIGNAVANVLTGNAGNDVLTGAGGDDTLDGGVGADKMNGGVGDDLYIVDQNGDLVTELANEGTDTVRASVDHMLAANVENLVLTGAALAGTGNDLGNAITGNELANLLSGGAGDDMLAGGAGDDTLDGGTGNDAMVGGAGNDTYVVGEAGDVVTEQSDEGSDTVRASIDYTLGANLENLVLTGAALAGTGNELGNAIAGNALANLLSGGAGDDMLAGGAGDDTLDGGTGVDSMAGGAGDDFYFVDSAGDSVIELGGEGNDTVSTGLASYTLGEHVENLVMTGSSANGTGNGLDNLLTGNAASNRLDGGAGNDTLRGGDGVDYLLGGAGADIFVGEINATKTASKLGAISLDVVLDFASGTDKIDLSGIDAVLGVAGDQAFKLVKSANPSNAGEISIRNFGNVNAAEAALGFDIDGVDGKSPFSGPVQVVLGNVDGGAVDFAMVFVGTTDILATDFLL